MMKKRIALVTGASRGIWEGITKHLITKGYYVHGTYRKVKDLIYKSFGKNPNVTIHYLDVGDENEVKKVISKVKQISGRLHLLINNAAVDYQTTIEDMTAEQWDETF